MEQRVINISREGYKELDEWIRKNKVKKIFFVCGKSTLHRKELKTYLEEMEQSEIEIFIFHEFQPNPYYESIVKGVDFFRKKKCDAIIAVGGGSAIDVAKCIKLYSNMNSTKNYLEQKIVPNTIPFLAIPTTAGTGSEATRYAVIYYKGEKQSITSESAIPETVLLDPNCLVTLPLYQRKVTCMDALCHAIESFWSVNSTEQSKVYSRVAIKGIISNIEGYLTNTYEGNAGMLVAANIAGKAINITQTTAGHAMCYKITSLFGCAHGHAAILCNRILFPWMLDNINKCIDPRGEEYLKEVFHQIAEAMGCNSEYDAARKLERIFEFLKLEIPSSSELQYEELKTSVNPVRLKNHPIALDDKTIDELYHKILN